MYKFTFYGGCNMKNFISLILVFCFVIGIFSIVPVSAKALTYGLYQYEELTAQLKLQNTQALM